MAHGQLSAVLWHIRRQIAAPGTDALTDRQLLECFSSQHDEAAFTALVQRHGAMVLGVCRRVMQDAHAAEDAFQATFLVLARKAGSMLWRESVGSWLHAVADRVARKAKATAAGQRLRERQALAMRASEPMPETGEQDLRWVLDRELQLMPEKYRMTKLKNAAGFLLILGVSALGASLLVRQALADRAAYQQEEASSGSQRTEPESPPARTDRYGEPLPPGAIARIGTNRFRHGIPVSTIAFAPDRKTLAWVDWEGGIHLWETATARELRRISAEGQGAPLAFSADGKMLVSGGPDQSIRLWDAATGRELRRFTGPRHQLSAIAFSPDGKLLASAVNYAPGAIRLWDTATGKEIRQIPSPDFILWTLVFSPDGKTLAAGSHDTKNSPIRLWEVATGKVLLQLTSAKFAHALGFSPDGRTLAWDCWDKTLRLLDVSTGKELPPVPTGDGSLAFSPDGKHLAARTAKRMALWDVAGRKQVRFFEGRLEDNGRDCWVAAFAPDGKTLVAAGNREIRQWDVATGKGLVHHQFNRGPAAGGPIEVSPDGKLLAAGNEPMDEEPIGLWDLSEQKQLRKLRSKKHLYGVYSLAFSPDGKTVAAGSDDNPWVLVWETATGKEVHQFKVGRCIVVAFSPNGQTLAAASGPGHLVRLWQLSTGEEVGAFVFGQQDWVNSISFSPDGKVLAAAMRNTIRLLDVTATKELRSWADPEPDGQRRTMNSVAFSPDGKHLASLSARGTIHLWEAATGKERRQFPGKGHTLAFSADGKTLAGVGEDNTIVLWETATGQERHRFQGHDAEVTTLAFTRDGRALASGSKDTMAVLWDTTGFSKEERARRPRTMPKDLEALWADLAGADAAKAFRAIGTLSTGSGQVIHFVQARLQPVCAPDRKRFAQLIAELDSPQFTAREKAMAELEKLGATAEPLLRQELAGTPSLEARRRLERVLERMQRFILTRDELQAWRAVEVLEQFDTAESRRLLERLSRGAPGARLTTDAKTALERLTKRAPATP